MTTRVSNISKKAPGDEKKKPEPHGQERKKEKEKKEKKKEESPPPPTVGLKTRNPPNCSSVFVVWPLDISG